MRLRWRTAAPLERFSAELETIFKEELNVMGYVGIIAALQSFGVGPDETEWIKNPLAGYGSDPGMLDRLRSGEVQFLSLDGVMEDPSWTTPYWNDDIAKFKWAELFASDTLLLITDNGAEILTSLMDTEEMIVIS